MILSLPPLHFHIGGSVTRLGAVGHTLPRLQTSLSTLPLLTAGYHPAPP